MTDIRQVSSSLCFGGTQTRFKHHSACNQCEMHFSVFVPESAVQKGRTFPVLYWLSGLTCTDENFVQKAGAQRVANTLNIILVAPDTSPRGDDVHDANEGEWDLGKGAGFYVNATQAPWAEHYQMFDYVTQELPDIIDQHFPTNGLCSISGHSMGGHGALICALKFPEMYQSVSAFAPIVNPCECPWGHKAFNHYLGDDQEGWKSYDTCELIHVHGLTTPTLIDQGTTDNFLHEQLKTEHLQRLVSHNDNITIHLREGYDHSYFFIASFIEQHIRFHAQHLGNN